MDAIISNRHFVALSSVELVKQLTGVTVYDNNLWGATWLNPDQRAVCAQHGADILFVGAIGLGEDGPDPDYDMVTSTMKVL